MHSFFLFQTLYTLRAKENTPLSTNTSNMDPIEEWRSGYVNYFETLIKDCPTVDTLAITHTDTLPVGGGFDLVISVRELHRVPPYFYLVLDMTNQLCDILESIKRYASITDLAISLNHCSNDTWRRATSKLRDNPNVVSVLIEDQQHPLPNLFQALLSPESHITRLYGLYVSLEILPLLTHALTQYRKIQYLEDFYVEAAQPGLSSLLNTIQNLPELLKFDFHCSPRPLTAENLAALCNLIKFAPCLESLGLRLCAMQEHIIDAIRDNQKLKSLTLSVTGDPGDIVRFRQDQNEMFSRILSNVRTSHQQNINHLSLDLQFFIPRDLKRELLEFISSDYVSPSLTIKMGDVLNSDTLSVILGVMDTLKHNAFVTTFSLDCSSIGGTPELRPLLVYFCSLLQNNKSLRSLSVRVERYFMNYDNQDLLPEFIASLNQNTTLEHLSISPFFLVTSDQEEKWIQTIVDHHSLTSVEIESNMVSDRCIDAMIRKNRRLESLCVDRTGSGTPPSFVKEYVHAIRGNPTLQRFQMHCNDNRMSDTGKDIHRALHINHSIEHKKTTLIQGFWLCLRNRARCAPN